MKAVGMFQYQILLIGGFGQETTHMEVKLVGRGVHQREKIAVLRVAVVAVEFCRALEQTHQTTGQILLLLMVAQEVKLVGMETM